MEIMRGLFESRVMGLSHIAALYFEGRQEAAKKRIQKLKSAGLIAERRRQLYELSILFLTRRGIDWLHEAGTLGDFPQLPVAKLERRMRVSPLTIHHEMDCMDAKVALTVAINLRPGFSIAEFSTWPLLYQFPSLTSRGVRVLVKPDGFIRINEGDAEHSYFLEVDRSTERQEILGERAYAYLEFYKRGGFAIRNGGRKEDFRDFPFRVLMVFRNTERRNNAAEQLLHNRPPIMTQVILTTMPEFLSAPLGQIWMQPIDYRDGLQGTTFDPIRVRAQSIYRRQPEREKLVDEAVNKVSML